VVQRGGEQECQSRESGESGGVHEGGSKWGGDGEAVVVGAKHIHQW
jgi:hypothetical protein